MAKQENSGQAYICTYTSGNFCQSVGYRWILVHLPPKSMRCSSEIKNLKPQELLYLKPSIGKAE